MPEIHVTDEQGTEHIFPDGSTPEMIAKVLNVKAPTASAAPASQPGFLENIGHAFGIGTQEAEARKQNLEQHPIRTILTDQPAVQAIQGVYQGGKRILGELGQAGSALLNGNAPDAAVHAITAVPFVGPALNKMADEAPPTTPGQSYASRVASAATPGNIGTAVGTAAQIAPMLLGAADKVAPDRATIPNPPTPHNPIAAIKSYLRPTPSPSIVPRTEMAARQLSAAIIPAGKDAPNFIQAAQQEVPNILDYAKRTGNPLTTQLEFNKAAQGYAQEVRNLYTQNVLGPVENKVVRTTGTGFGERMNEGQETYATLGEIDDRIVKLNKQLDAPAANADDARRALASRDQLESEAKGLKTILHNNLAETSGLTPAEIADLRQRVGRSYELANDTNAAVTQRMQETGKADLKPIKMGELPSRTLNFVRGNQVNIADRHFQRAIANFPGQSSPLPTVNQPVTMRPAVSPAESQFQRLEQLLSTARKQQDYLRSQP